MHFWWDALFSFHYSASDIDAVKDQPKLAKLKLRIFLWKPKMFGMGDFWLEIRVIIKMSTHPCYPRNWWIFMGMKQKKKFQNGRLNSPANFQYFFQTISEIGLWVRRINWCERHWFCSTYMVNHQPDNRRKAGEVTARNAFSVFPAYLHIWNLNL